LGWLFEARIDGVALERDHLRGKLAPDSFLAAEGALGVEPAHAVVFEEALADGAAGRAGGFGGVVGVGPAGQAEALREHGATVVVADLSELLDAP
jgi:beta-phosphoglucomutase-like phosphatase (HAD superfamily)